MKITQITVTHKRTIQIRRFEPLTVELGAAADVDESDNVQDAYARLLAELREATRAYCVPFVEAAGFRVKEQESVSALEQI
jgi:hypothetical protein